MRHTPVTLRKEESLPADTATARADTATAGADPETAPAAASAAAERRPPIKRKAARPREVLLDQHRLLGRSGLRVSPLALGTMTFGADWGWGAKPNEAQRMFDAYLDHGGNFIDSANTYTDGTAERLVGEFAAGRRDRLVIATKYTAARSAEDANSGGNHRKSMISSVEHSLRVLQTDYVDLLYLHFWDGTTPVEEILRAMDDLIHAGKVLCVGICGTPAWQVARMQAIADLRGWAPLVALQTEYSLIERTAERELIPMAGEMGLAVIPCSPLASGVLAGKYTAADLDLALTAEPAGTRRSLAATSGALSERGLALAKVVSEIAAELETSAARVALAWTLLNPAVTVPIIGARTLAQLEDNLGALALELGSGQRERLASASAIDTGPRRDLLARPLAIAASARAGRAAARAEAS
jgi:aryl-alcohol dehydrogenase-like predicted oxidoreductase